MDRNSIIGLLLIFGILMGYAYFNQPSAEQLAEQKRLSDSIALVEQTKQLEAQKIKASTKATKIVAEEIKDSSTLVTKFGEIGTKMQGVEQTVILQNKDLKVALSNKGARIAKAELPPYKRSDSSELVLFDKEHAVDYFVFKYQMGNAIEFFNSAKFYWDLVAYDSIKGTANYRFNFDDNSYIESRFAIDETGFGINQTLHMHQMDEYIAFNSDLSYYREVEAPKQELKAETEREKSTIYFKYQNEKPDYIGETKFESLTLKGISEWVSFKQQFFNTTVICAEGFKGESKIETKEPLDAQNNVKLFVAELELPFENKKTEEINLRYFLGPNQYKHLVKEDNDLEGIIPLGWTLFRWVNKFLVIPTFNFLSQYIGNYGIIILLLTIFIKLLLFPMVYKSYLSTAKMKLLKPEIDEIKEKVGDDMSKVQMETMKLYKKAGVSPLGGCLPLVLQFPILIAMFSFFPAAFELRQQSFLWAADLSRYDSIFDFPGGFSIPFYGDHVSLFTLLMTVSTILYTRMNNQLTSAGAQMKIISYLMPIMFLGFFNNYPAALSYYYFLANMITFGQQAIMKRFVDEDALHAKIAENKKKNVTIKKSSFQKRLEDYAKKKGIDPNTGKRKK